MQHMRHRDLRPAARRHASDASAIEGGCRLLLKGRRGWHGVQLGVRAAVPLFLWHYHGTTYCFDMSCCSTLSPVSHDGKVWLRLGMPEDLRLALTTLAEYRRLRREDSVLSVMECAVDARVMADAFDFRIANAWAITAPLPAKKGASRQRTDESCSCSSAAESNADRHEEAEKDPQVDTDVESGVEDTPAAPSDEEQGNISSESEEDAAFHAPSAAGDVAAPSAVHGALPARTQRRSERAPPGATWIWSSISFFVSQNPEYGDIKIRTRRICCSGSEGMGATFSSKSLTPRHYGETPSDCPKTVILLRSWALWRVRRNNWCDQRRYRQREVAVLVAALRADIAVFGAARPLLGNATAQQRLNEWVPDIVASL